MALAHMDEKSRHEIETPVWSEDMLKQRRARAKAMAWALLGFMALVFAVTLVKLGANVLDRSM
ncbi:MAG: hypothetical protein P1U69_10810 [Parvibaculaceae bacterium]|jgi:hypothetical protein|nr:hypothetical protein RHODOSMS8_00216 [Rhodobiaceae bacterium]MCR9240071.1 hypothetical protein [Rhodobiaceae bacterium]MDF1847679.1 hypothetical protein [Parvibaculaceae bacterium]|tara:strand:- start:191 stop:379 length:189 start_codon:yes stop_codon:yes gene_type:complete